EAKGITEKAEAMKQLDGVGREHEEFRLSLEKDKIIQLADIDAQRDIASRHSEVVATALENANVDIIGGETTFFDKIAGAITTGKAVDRALDNSRALTDIKETFFNGDPDYFQSQLRQWLDQFGFSSEDLKNLTISAALGQMIAASDDEGIQGKLRGLLENAKRFGMANANAAGMLKQLAG
ncbi:MAG: flotillin family protein, partial [Verrucomicrobiales bacterium]